MVELIQQVDDSVRSSNRVASTTYSVAINQLQRNAIPDEQRLAAANFCFQTWHPDNLHWHAPSHMTFYDDGIVYLYADYIANNRPGAGGAGFTYNFAADYVFFALDGTPLYRNQLLLATLGYNRSLKDTFSTGLDAFLRDNIFNIGSVHATPVIY